MNTYLTELKTLCTIPHQFFPYEDLITTALERPQTKPTATQILGYVERHHIKPRSMGGTDVTDNLVYLTAQEHFNAHTYLHKAFPDNAAMCAALWIMCNTRKNNDGQPIYCPVEYEKLRSEYSTQTSDKWAGYSRVYEESTGTYSIIPTELFHNSSAQYRGLTKGFVRVQNLVTGEYECLSVEEYNSRTDVVKMGYFSALDNTTGNLVIVNKHEFANNPNMVSIHKGIVVALNMTTGKTERVSVEEFNIRDELVGKLFNKVPVINTKTGERTTVSHDEFESNSDLVSHNSGYIIATDTRTGKRLRVTKEEFKNAEYYTGMRTGCTVAFDKVINTNRVVTLEEYENNTNLTSINAKKAVVYDRVIKQYTRINANEFDSAKHIVRSHTHTLNDVIVLKRRFTFEDNTGKTFTHHCLKTASTFYGVSYEMFKRYIKHKSQYKNIKVTNLEMNVIP